MDRGVVRLPAFGVDRRPTYSPSVAAAPYALARNSRPTNGASSIGTTGFFSFLLSASYPHLRLQAKLAAGTGVGESVIIREHNRSRQPVRQAFAALRLLIISHTRVIF